MKHPEHVPLPAALRALPSASFFRLQGNLTHAPARADAVVTPHAEALDMGTSLGSSRRYSFRAVIRTLSSSWSTWYAHWLSDDGRKMPVSPMTRPARSSLTSQRTSISLLRR